MSLRIFSVSLDLRSTHLRQVVTVVGHILVELVLPLDELALVLIFVDLSMNKVVNSQFVVCPNDVRRGAILVN